MWLVLLSFFHNLPLTGIAIPGSRMFPSCHRSISCCAARSESALQLRKCSIGRWFIIVQNFKPLQPSWHGSSTVKTEWCAIKTLETSSPTVHIQQCPRLCYFGILQWTIALLNELWRKPQTFMSKKIQCKRFHCIYMWYNYQVK
mgnify:CR=1 FL=1